MGLHVLAFTIAAQDPARVADFWEGLLGWERVGPSTLLPDDATGFHLHVERTDGPKVVANHVHPDLTTTSDDDQRRLVDRARDLGARWGGPPLEPRIGRSRVHLDVAPYPGGDRQVEVDRLLGLGASYLDIGQGDVGWTVLADPDGRELCVLEPAGPVRGDEPGAP